MTPSKTRFFYFLFLSALDVFRTNSGVCDTTPTQTLEAQAIQDPIWIGPNGSADFYPGDTIVGKLNLTFRGSPFSLITCFTATNSGPEANLVKSININNTTIVNQEGYGTCSVGITVSLPNLFNANSVKFNTTVHISYL